MFLKKILVAAVVAIGLAGCGTLSAVAEKAAPGSPEAIRTGAEYVFEGFKTGWIPLLKAYRLTLPKCDGGNGPMCWNPKVYAKLYAVTDVATACMVASTAPGVPIAQLQACVTSVEYAKSVFSKEGVVPEELKP